MHKKTKLILTSFERQGAAHYTLQESLSPSLLAKEHYRNVEDVLSHLVLAVDLCTLIQEGIFFKNKLTLSTNNFWNLEWCSHVVAGPSLWGAPDSL